MCGPRSLSSTRLATTRYHHRPTAYGDPVAYAVGFFGSWQEQAGVEPTGCRPAGRQSDLVAARLACSRARGSASARTPGAPVPRSRASWSDNDSRAARSRAICPRSVSASIRAFRSAARRLAIWVSRATQRHGLACRDGDQHDAYQHKQPLQTRALKAAHLSHQGLTIYCSSPFPNSSGLITVRHDRRNPTRPRPDGCPRRSTGGAEHHATHSTQSEADKNDGSTPKEFKALKYRLIGPAAGGRVSRAAGVPGDPASTTQPLPPAACGNRSTAARRWKADLRRSADLLDWIDCDRRIESQHRLRRVGRSEHSRQRRGRQRHLQIVRCRQDLDARVEARRPDRQDDRSSRQSGHCFAAVLGHAFGPNAERGVYRTNDGGKTWEQVLKKDENTGASDVEMDPSNPSIVFAGLWQARRLPWDLVSGGPGSGLYVSRDGGDTWKQLKGEGLPEGIWGKIGIAIAPSDSRRIYALIEAEKGGLFRSDDGGATWELVESFTRAAPACLVLLDADRESHQSRGCVVSAGADAPLHRWRQDASVRQRPSPR